MNLSSASLRSLLSLTEKREKLLGELSAIEAQISSALNGIPAKQITHPEGAGGKIRAAKPAKRGGKGGKRGAVKELILAGLKEAGEAGIAVKHLAAKLAIKPQNIHVWLHTTGKKSGLVEAAGKGIYRLKESVGVETPSSIVEVPKPKATATVAKKARKKRRPAKVALKKART